MATGEPDNDDIADALSRMADGLPDKPQRPVQPPGSAAEFRAPARPAAPNAKSPRDAAPAAPAKPKPPRPDRPDRPVSPTTDEGADAGAQEAAEYNPLTRIVDDDAVIVPAPEPEVFAPHPREPAEAAPRGIRSLAFRRTVIPILLTCGALLIGIGLLRWLAGRDSIFADMAIGLSAALCGCGAFLLLVAVLNMLQVKAELSASAAPAKRDA